MEELVTERLIIRSTPERCYQVLTDFEGYPQWASDIKAVSIDERDDQGRACRVTYQAAAFGRSTSYTLVYDYRAAPGELSWVQVDGDLTRRLDGAYVIEASEDHDSEVAYRLSVELKVPLPGFVKRRAESRIAATALEELKVWVESGQPVARD